MEIQAVAQRYFDAWNRHDPAVIVASFAEGGAYNDPATRGDLTGAAIGAYAAGLFAAFPDLSFDLISAAPAGENTIAAQWLMRGINTGPFGYSPPTGQAVVLPGADFITVEGDRLRAVQGYFDQKAFVEQLGLDVMLAPAMLRPATTPPPEALADEAGAYVAALWEHPSLCVAVLSVQYLTPEAERIYAESGIQMEIRESLEAARQDGLLSYRYLFAPGENVLLQYWRSEQDLNRWARQQPHTRWWRWLNQNNGPALGFSQEIYEARAAEAIYTAHTRPVGAATFCSLEAVPMGRGRSRERLARFVEVAEQAHSHAGFGR